MKNYVILLFFTFLLYTYSNYAMQPSLATIKSTIFKELTVPQSSHAIAYDSDGNIIVVDNGCMLINSQFFESSLRVPFQFDDIVKSRIIIYPNHTVVDVETKNCGNMVVDFSNTKSNILLNCIKDRKANMMFSSTETLWTILHGNLTSYSLFDKGLQCCPSLSEYRSSASYKVLDIKLGLIFECSWSDYGYYGSFLCCDNERKALYRIIPSENTIVRLFKFHYKIDWNHWVYNPQLQLLCAINKVNQQLYIANFKTSEQKMISLPNFKIGALALHPDFKFLVLLSTQRDKLCYFYYKNLVPFLLTHTVSQQNVENAPNGQILACSPDGKDITILLLGKSLVIKVPGFIRENVYEKYCMLKKLDIIPQDLKQELLKFLLVLSR